MSVVACRSSSIRARSDAMATTASLADPSRAGTRADEDGARDRAEAARFTPTADGSAFEVERVGRCPLFVDGKAEDGPTITAGDTLLLEPRR